MSITAAMLPALLGRPVAYQPVFTRLPGVTVQGAIFLSQALFLTNTPTAAKREGWFWKEQAGEVDSWESETGMSAKQQVTARRQLTRIGVLEEVRKGVPAKTWYRVNSDALAAQLALALSEEGTEKPPETPAAPQTLPTGETENAQPEKQEPPEGSAQNHPNGVFLQRLQQRVPPLSNASAHNVFQQAAQSTDDGAPPPTGQRRFAMTLDWQPEPEHLAMACQRIGLPADTQPAPHQLAKFTAHHADHPERQHGAGNWHAKLADWLRNDLKHAPTQAGAAHADRTGSHSAGARRDERDAIRQQLADPHDTSWADGMWADDEEPHDAGAQGGGHRAGGQDFYPAGGDFSEDVLECVPDHGHAQAQPARGGAGAGALADAADASDAGAGDQRHQAIGQYVAADDPRADRDAEALRRGRGHA